MFFRGVEIVSFKQLCSPQIPELQDITFDLSILSSVLHNSYWVILILGVPTGIKFCFLPIHVIYHF